MYTFIILRWHAPTKGKDTGVLRQVTVELTREAARLSSQQGALASVMPLSTSSFISLLRS